ncbi:hypothetical protein [Kineosporia sp. NBRC 101731]|uniref:hypothetical protein n=1 Tax=Kineosporia sp. NBRC 101731 TaxID=3032199 RepID=UPI0024A4E9B3|nr:hypothetical protein [Kineosporia sp. NBRC 101731]GLY28938.1 hypothetical protein Kisp02_23030 [Kineosporia sp. NBRC 101731]
MASNEYGMNLAPMNAIITQTGTTHTGMVSTGSQVASGAQSIGSSTVADSGRLMVQNYGNWGSNFQATHNKLNELNERTTNLRNTNITYNNDATSQAGSVTDGGYIGSLSGI